MWSRGNNERDKRARENSGREEDKENRGKIKWVIEGERQREK